MKKKILVVDNHPVILKYMTHLLEKQGHQAMTAEDGLSAVDILETYVPDAFSRTDRFCLSLPCLRRFLNGNRRTFRVY